MTCYSEQALERAACEALDLGLRLDGKPLQAPLPAGPLGRVLDHARGCLRCHELLVLMQETEAGLRCSRADESTSPSAPLRLALAPLRLGPASRGAAPLETPAYALAAHTERDAPAQTPVLSLATSDGRFLVRIFPRASGAGATAILMRGDAPAEGASEPTAEISLEIEGVVYTFDEKGMAELPQFPAQAIALLIR